MRAVFSFLASSAGRVVRVVAGIALIAIGCLSSKGRRVGASKWIEYNRIVPEPMAPLRCARPGTRA